jgi:hypothetical protein
MPRLTLARTLALVVLALALMGCGKSGYPRVPAASPLGRHGRCDACGREIAAVAREHLFSFQGIQYTVCSQACEAQLEDDIVHDRLGMPSP